MAPFPPPSLPDGLAGRVLDNLHHYQAVSARRSEYAWRGLFAVLLSALLASIVFAVYRFNQSGATDFISTVALNYDAISWKDSLFGLVEALPLDSLALIAVTTTLLFGLFSLHKTTHHDHLHLI